MEKIRKNYTVCKKSEHISDIKLMALCIQRGYADFVFESIRQEISDKLKFKFGERLRFDTIKGLHKVSEKTLSKVEGNNEQLLDQKAEKQIER